MYYNGKKGKHVASFLNEVHSAMKAKYSTNTQKEIENAKKMQQFLQELKVAAAGESYENPIKGLEIDTILQRIDVIRKTHRRSTIKITNLFRTKGSSQYQGLAFEQDLSDMIEALYDMVGINANRDDILVGAKTASVGEIVERDCQKIVTDLGEAAVNELQKQKDVKWYSKKVMGKQDIRGLGYNVEFLLNPTNALEEIVSLFNFATISAKSYNSMKYDQQINEWVAAEGRTTIHLGKSDPYRAIYGALSSLHTYDNNTIVSAYYAGRNMINKKHEGVINHIYHLRYIYELTGAGLLYDGGVSLGDVRYLIYNDPSGGIYVKSTAEIVSDLLNEKVRFAGDPLQAIEIGKETFS